MTLLVHLYKSATCTPSHFSHIKRRSFLFPMMSSFDCTHSDRSTMSRVKVMALQTMSMSISQCRSYCNDVKWSLAQAHLYKPATCTPSHFTHIKRRSFLFPMMSSFDCTHSDRSTVFHAKVMALQRRRRRPYDVVQVLSVNRTCRSAILCVPPFQVRHVYTVTFFPYQASVFFVPHDVLFRLRPLWPVYDVACKSYRVTKKTIV